MAKRFKCIKGFLLEVVDGDGFTIEDEYMDIEKDSVWELEEEQKWTLTGAELRLNRVNGTDWIETHKEHLEEDFIEI